MTIATAKAPPQAHLDVPFALIRLQSFTPRPRPFPAHIGNALAAAEFIRDQVTNFTPQWQHAVAVFNGLGETGDFRGFRKAFIAALQSESWAAKEFASASELEKLILTELRKHDGCQNVVGIAIIKPPLKAWDIAITRKGAAIDDVAWAIAQQVANQLLQKYDLRED